MYAQIQKISTYPRSLIQFKTQYNWQYISLILSLLGFWLVFINHVAVGLGFIKDHYQTISDYIILLSGPACLTFACIALLIPQPLKLQKFYRHWLSMLLFYVVILYIYGFFCKNSFRLMGQDTLTFIFLFAGLVLGSIRANSHYYDRAIFLQTLIAALFFLFFFFYDGSYLFIGNRPKLTWTHSYLFWGLLYAWPYLLLTYNNSNNYRKIATILITLLFFIFSIIFQKRAPTLTLGIFLMIVSIMKFKIGKSFKTNLWFTLCIMVLLINIAAFIRTPHFFPSISQEEIPTWQVGYSRQFNGNNTEGFFYHTLHNPRFTNDVILTLKTLSPKNIIWGQGIGAAVHATWLKGRTQAGELHNGLMTILLKGGLLLLALWSIGWSKFSWALLKNKNVDDLKYYIPAILALIMSPISAIPTHGLNFFVIMLLAGAVTRENRKRTTLCKKHS